MSDSVMERQAGQVNLNDYVWVKLTELGWKLYDDSHRALGLDPAPYRASIGLPGGYQRFQLWELMQIFGPHCGLGRPAGFFDGPDVWFTDPTHTAESQASGGAL